MQKLLLLLLLLAFTSCDRPSPSSANPGQEIKDTLIQITDIAIQDILDNASLSGSILIYEPNSNTAFSNNFKRCDSGFLPASTFKIPNAIIALETGVVEDDSSLFRWDGQPRRLKIWEKDMSFKEAFHLSCVPCYQEIARKIGYNRMKKHLNSFGYGTMHFDSSQIDVFWLSGDSRITQWEQIKFLQNFHNKSLGISDRTDSIMKVMMIIETGPDYILRGKTGWSIRDGLNVGWFVGYVQTPKADYFFATNVEPLSSFDLNTFARIRIEVTIEALKQREIL